VTSGIRLGTPATTTRGLKERDYDTVADFIDRALGAKDNPAALKKIRDEVAAFAAKFPMPH
jgi:glycine hydroxymethyltransferase